MEENEVREESTEKAEVVATVETEKKDENKTTSTGKMENKYWNMLSYAGVLWIITMFACPDKDSKETKFHIGQGMLITVLFIITSIINNVIIANIFTTTVFWGVRTTSSLGYSIMWILNFVPVVFAIIGAMSAYKGAQKELPVVGKFAFYK